MNHKVSRIRQPVSPGVIDIRLPAKPEVTPKICSYADSGLRRFTLPEGRNLHLEVVRFLLSCRHQQYPRTETAPRELEQDALCCPPAEWPFLPRAPRYRHTH